jgi:glycosyltransferase involved in cell wall biosynthesis
VDGSDGSHDRQDTPGGNHYCIVRCVDEAKFSVTVSVLGRFHGYDLARELDRRGHLRALMTSQPRSRVAKWGVPRGKITSLVRHEGAVRVAQRTGILDLVPHLDYLASEGFDRAMARRLPPSDVVVAWSAKALHTLRKARSQGAMTVVERGSSHIATQRRLMEDELQRWGVRTRLPPVDPWTVDKEMQEYAEADAIAIPSTFVRRTFLENGVPESKLVQVPYGVNLDSFRSLPRTDARFRVLFVGGLSLRKGIPYLLEAARLADAELWLVGPVHDEVRSMIPSSSKVRLFGKVPQARLPEFYAQADAFIIPSIEEGMAVVILQALACGCPVICTPNSGGEDVVVEGRNGFVIPLRDPGAIADRIERLRSNPTLQKEMSAAARASVQGSRSWGDYADQLIVEYGRLLARRGSHQPG